jgi:hypothetical protein
MHIRDAVNAVQRDLEAAQESKNDDIVVVIDTCGEQSNRGNPRFFNVDFTGWTYIEVWANLNRADLPGYFA